MVRLLEMPVEIIHLIVESPRNLGVKDLYSLLRTHRCLFNLLLPQFNHLAATEHRVNAICWASAIGNEPMMRLLEEKGAVSIRGQVRGQKQCEMILKTMRGARANIKLRVNTLGNCFTGSAADPAIYHAMTRRAHRLTRLLLDEGAIVNMYLHGQTLLHIAAFYGAEDTSIKKIIELGAYVNARDHMGNTPLHCLPVTRYSPQDEKFTEFLLENGADTLIQDGQGRNVIQRRLHRFKWDQLPLRETKNMNPRDLRFREELRLLLRNGNVMYKDRRERSGLHMAAASNDVDLAEALICGGIDVSSRDCHNKTALHFAAKSGFTRITRMLIEAGAYTAPQDKYGTTPLHHATRFNHLGIFRILLWKGVDISVPDARHSTALHSAAKWGDVVVLRLLLRAGADVNARDKEGRTPLLLAARYRHIAAVKLLSDNGVDMFAQDNRGRGAPLCVLHEVCTHPERCFDVAAPNVSLVNRLRREKDKGVWYTLCRDFFGDVEVEEGSAR